MKHFPVRITSAVTVISLATLATFATLATGVVRAAENFPTKPVRLVVAFPIAGATDILARHFALKMSEQLGYQMIVDNRPGAGGTIGSKIVSGAIADGYTLTMGTTSTHAIGPHLYSSKPYDPINDFTAVTQMCVSPTVMMVAAQVPAKSLKEFIALAKAQPGKLNFGSSGIGTQFHLSGELLKLLAGINIVHVPYKGTALVYPDMIAGQIQMLFDVPPAALPFIKQGRVRALGISGAKRTPVLPDTPTIAEAGLAGYEADLWWGLFAPPKMAKERLARVHAEAAKALTSPDVKERYAGMGTDVVASAPEAFTAFMKIDSAKWEKVVKASGARAD
jgi:tripartite-type tricarboxylate transporter receptor subunit TctC